MSIPDLADFLGVDERDIDVAMYGANKSAFALCLQAIAVPGHPEVDEDGTVLGEEWFLASDGVADAVIDGSISVVQGCKSQ